MAGESTVKRRGFTLVELLIVLMIIAVLAAMLFPVFARARQSARKTTCLSNIANLGNALQMYAVDWQSALPPKDNDWAPVFVYVKNIDVLHCAMDPKRVSYTGDGSPAHPIAIPYSSYIYRSGLHNDDLATEVVSFDRQIWHLGGRNVLFLDAHGKWFPANGFWQYVPERVLALDPVYQALNDKDREAARKGTLQRRESWE